MGESKGFDKVFTIAKDTLGLTDRQALIAKAFWNAFGSVALGSKDDNERNSKLLEDLNKLGAEFIKIKVNNAFEDIKVPFYTVKIYGEQLISPSGDVEFHFKPGVDTPKLSTSENVKYCTVKIGLSDLSQKIITGAVAMHGFYSKGSEMRPDLLKRSQTMNDHFIQSILAVGDIKIG